MLKFWNSGPFSRILQRLMLKHKKIKGWAGTFLLMMTLWVALPKVYIHNLFHHSHEIIKVDGQTRLQSEQSTEDCDFDQYNKPVYFNIFTFISKIIPVKPRNTEHNNQSGIRLPGASVLISLLRAPPQNN
jgi:hypothetical protein